MRVGFTFMQPKSGIYWFAMPVERWIVSSTLVFLAACAPSHAINQAPQPLAPVSPGDQLRVTHNGHCCTSPSIGLEESMSRDSIVLRAEAGTARLAIARSNISRIERWNRGRTHKSTGAILG